VHKHGEENPVVLKIPIMMVITIIIMTMIIITSRD
jgi:hypothetical protein